MCEQGGMPVPPTQGEYEVLKMMKQGACCYKVSAYATGQLLIHRLHQQPSISKDLLFQWLKELTIQLEQYQNCLEYQSIHLLTPYSIVITEEDYIFLLDFDAPSNQEFMFNMPKKAILDKFIITKRRHISNQIADFYSLGMVFQFILSQTSIEPKLSKLEERKLSHIINMCTQTQSKQYHQTFHKILKELPKSNHKKCKKRSIIIFSTCIVVCISCIYTSPKQFDVISLQGNQTSNEKESRSNNFKGYDVDTFFELGMVQFMEEENYKKSAFYFDKIAEKNEVAELYKIIAKFLIGDLQGDEKFDVEQHIEQLEQLELYKDLELEIDRSISCMRVYALLDSEESRQAIIKIGEKVVASRSWKNSDYKKQMEVRNYLAAAYDQLQRLEQALEQYQEIMALLRDNNVLNTSTFRRISELYIKTGEGGKSIDVMKLGIERFPKSMELRLGLIYNICKTQAPLTQVWLDEIELQMNEQPEIVEQELFIHLLEECGIHKEGDKLWVKN